MTAFPTRSAPPSILKPTPTPSPSTVSGPTPPPPPPPPPPTPLPPPAQLRRVTTNVLADAFLEAVTGINIDRLADSILEHATRRRVSQRAQSTPATQPSTVPQQFPPTQRAPAAGMALVPALSNQKRHFPNPGPNPVPNPMPAGWYSPSMHYMNAVCLSWLVKVVGCLLVLG
jgi:hypothetical protein